MAVVGAALAAVAAGIAWGLLVKLRGGELDPAPILVGLVVGLMTRFFGGGEGRDSGGLHAIAAVFTLVGVLIGKYLTFVYLYAETIPTEPTVQPSPIDASVLSTDTFRLFLENLGLSFSAVDGLWILVGLATAMLALVPSEEAEAKQRHRDSHNPVDKVTGGLPEPLRVAADWIITIVGAIAIVLIVKQFAINPYRIPSSSMEPTLHCARSGGDGGCEARFSDRILANRFVYHLHDPRRGDIIVFNVPKKALAECNADGVFVKRLIGLPGETIAVRVIKGKSYVFINGRKLNEAYIEGARRGDESYEPRKIPAGHYFMMGDNRKASCDSRRWGTVPRANIIGKVFATYWPPGRISLH
jgi:signal peptidase I